MLNFQSIYNRLEYNYHLSNKKALFHNMITYYQVIGENPYKALPLTFHCAKGMEDVIFKEFLAYFEKDQQKIRAAVHEFKNGAKERRKTMVEDYRI